MMSYIGNNQQNHLISSHLHLFLYTNILGRFFYLFRMENSIMVEKANDIGCYSLSGHEGSIED